MGRGGGIGPRMDHGRHGNPSPYPAGHGARHRQGKGGNVRQASGVKHGNRGGNPAGTGRQRPQADSGGGNVQSYLNLRKISKQLRIPETWARNT